MLTDLVEIDREQMVPALRDPQNFRGLGFRV